MFLLLHSLVLGLVFIASARGFANPGACSGDCFAHDPALVRRSSDGVYFRFNTGNEIGIWKSSSLTGPWTYQGKVLPSGSGIKLAGSTDLWAPDVHQVGSLYILYYAVSTFGSQASAIGYATSTTMEAGSWTDRGSTGISSSSGKPYNAIDPNLIQTGEGSYLMTFGSFWGDIYQMPMNAAATASTGSSIQIAYNASGKHAVEGAFMHFHDDYYYLFFSAGVCCGYVKEKPPPGMEYVIRVCRSQAASGPFADRDGRSCTAGGGTPVLASHGTVYGPGGQGVMSDPNYGTVLYYHYANTTIGLADSKYQFGWNTVNWTDGWPTV